MSIKVQGDTVIFDNKAIRPGRFTTAERLAISSPSNGMVVYDTDQDELYVYNGSDWEQIISSGATIATPTITVEGAPNDVPEEPTLTGSSFSLDEGSGTHFASDWEIRRSSNDEVVFASLIDTNNLTSIVVPAGILEVSTEYVFRVRYRLEDGNASNFGSSTATTTVFEGIDFLGQPYCGGFYIGTICAAGQCYALIVAPNTTGCTVCQWKTTNTATAGTDSFVDGVSNTYGPMDNADHPAGNWTATRTINGFSDWYLPARDELNQLYVNDGGSTNTTLPAGEGFAAVNYWSSTEYSATNACNQFFLNGFQSSSFGKTSSLRVRAVRREPI